MTDRGPDANSDSDDGGLTLPEPGAWLRTKAEPNLKPSPAPNSNTARSPMREKGASKDLAAENNTDSETEANTGESREHESMTKIMLRLLTDRVYKYVQEEIPSGCHVQIEDTTNEFSNKAARFDTRQPLKTTSRLFELFSKNLHDWGLKLISVTRVHNAMSWSRYQSELECLHEYREKSWQENERYLFHGTRVESLETILSEGLDARLARNGRLGEGIYFSDSPLKAYMYSSQHNTRRHANILVCRVILGESKKYANGERRTDTERRREPFKGKQDGKLLYYDSACGRPKDFTEYVVYQNSRVFVEYVLDVSEDFATLRRKVETVFKERDQPTVQMLVRRTADSQDLRGGVGASSNYPRYVLNYDDRFMSDDPSENTPSVRLQASLYERLGISATPKSSKHTNDGDDKSLSDSDSEGHTSEVPDALPGDNWVSRFLPPARDSLFNPRKEANTIGDSGAAQGRHAATAAQPRHQADFGNVQRSLQLERSDAVSSQRDDELLPHRLDGEPDEALPIDYEDNNILRDSNPERAPNNLAGEPPAAELDLRSFFVGGQANEPQPFGAADRAYRRSGSSAASSGSKRGTAAFTVENLNLFPANLK